MTWTIYVFCGTDRIRLPAEMRELRVCLCFFLKFVVLQPAIQCPKGFVRKREIQNSLLCLVA